MKKSLVIVAHPKINQSIVHKRWVAELKKYPEKFTIHEIYKAYPNGVINIAKEQYLIKEHKNLIFQFPIYWFNCPPLLKQWLDDVLTHGWAYGSKGDNLKNKKIMLAVSAGIKFQDYSDTGRYKLPLSQVLYPFELTALYIQANYQPIYALYGMDTNPSQEDITPSMNEIDDSAIKYIQRLIELDHLSL